MPKKTPEEIKALAGLNTEFCEYIQESYRKLGVGEPNLKRLDNAVSELTEEYGHVATDLNEVNRDLAGLRAKKEAVFKEIIDVIRPAIKAKMNKKIADLASPGLLDRNNRFVECLDENTWVHLRVNLTAEQLQERYRDMIVGFLEQHYKLAGNKRGQLIYLISEAFHGTTELKNDSTLGQMLRDDLHVSDNEKTKILDLVSILSKKSVLDAASDISANTKKVCEAILLNTSTEASIKSLVSITNKLNQHDKTEDQIMHAISHVFGNPTANDLIKAEEKTPVAALTARSQSLNEEIMQADRTLSTTQASRAAVHATIANEFKTNKLLLDTLRAQALHAAKRYFFEAKKGFMYRFHHRAKGRKRVLDYIQELFDPRLQKFEEAANLTKRFFEGYYAEGIFRTNAPPVQSGLHKHSFDTLFLELLYNEGTPKGLFKLSMNRPSSVVAQPSAAAAAVDEDDGVKISASDPKVVYQGYPPPPPSDSKPDSNSLGTPAAIKNYLERDFKLQNNSPLQLTGAVYNLVNGDSAERLSEKGRALVRAQAIGNFAKLLPATQHQLVAQASAAAQPPAVVQPSAAAQPSSAAVADEKRFVP